MFLFYTWLPFCVISFQNMGLKEYIIIICFKKHMALFNTGKLKCFGFWRRFWKAVNSKLTCSFLNQIMENWFVIATFKFVRRFLWCHHSNETFLVERFSLYSIFLGILWREFDCFCEVFFVHWITRYNHIFNNSTLTNCIRIQLILFLQGAVVLILVGNVLKLTIFSKP